MTESSIDLDEARANEDRSDRSRSSLASTELLRTYHVGLEQPLEGVVELPALDSLSWRARYDIESILGRGAQGVVYLARREGVDGYNTRVALKVFYPPPRWTTAEYEAEMRRVAVQAQLISVIQHDGLVTIRDFVSVDDNRVMVLEWVDGLDLEQLLDLDRLRRLEARLPGPIRDHLHDVIVTAGEHHCRLKSGIAVDIVRGCLAGLLSLHHQNIAHCDLKPANIMIKRTGTKKIIDVDSSCVVTREDPFVRGTPYYMAPEQHQGHPVRMRSDVASLGYVLIEMLTGQRLFEKSRTKEDLLAEKLSLPKRLHRILPVEVRSDSLLFELVRKMVAPDPRDRFPDAEAAELDPLGAASFHRHLVKSDLSTEYEHELAWWLELLFGNDVDDVGVDRP